MISALYIKHCFRASIKSAVFKPIVFVASRVVQTNYEYGTPRPAVWGFVFERRISGTSLKAVGRLG
jgi:hypothetical protein